MSVKDTCPCGARVELSYGYSPRDSEEHKLWLAAHADCRKRAATEPPPVSIWPFYRASEKP